MIIGGTVAEFNPFHNGHAGFAARAREMGITHLIAVMSGNFVQRGEPAILPAPVRAKAALECGVDLILQLFKRLLVQHLLYIRSDLLLDLAGFVIRSERADIELRYIFNSSALKLKLHTC